MEFTVNHSEAGGFEPIKPGEYEAVISDVEVAKSSKGNDMIKVTLTIRDDYEQEFQKRKVRDYLVATKEAMWKFQQLFKALQFEDGKRFPGGIVEVAKAVLHKPVRVKVKNEKDQNDPDKLWDRVDFYTQSRKPFATPLSADDPFAIPANSGESDPFSGGGAAVSDDNLPF